MHNEKKEKERTNQTLKLGQQQSRATRMEGTKKKKKNSRKERKEDGGGDGGDGKMHDGDTNW